MHIYTPVLNKNTVNVCELNTYVFFVFYRLKFGCKNFSCVCRG